MQRIFHPTWNPYAAVPVAARPEIAQWFPGTVAPLVLRPPNVWGSFFPTVLIMVALLATIVAGQWDGKTVVLTLALPLCLAALLMSPILHWCKARRSEAMEARDFADKPDTTCFTVAVSIVQDNVTTGMDFGVAWVEQGALFFSGRRCSFAVPVQQLKMSPAESLGALVGPTVPVGLAHPSRTVRLDIRPLGRSELGFGSPLRYQIRSMMSLVATSPVEAQYPPLTVQPGLRVGAGASFVIPFVVLFPLIALLPMAILFRTIVHHAPHMSAAPLLPLFAVPIAVMPSMFVGPLAVIAKRTRTLKRLSEEPPWPGA